MQLIGSYKLQVFQLINCASKVTYAQPCYSRVFTSHNDLLVCLIVPPHWSPKQYDNWYYHLSIVRSIQQSSCAYIRSHALSSISFSLTEIHSIGLYKSLRNRMSSVHDFYIEQLHVSLNIVLVNSSILKTLKKNLACLTWCWYHLLWSEPL